jgi:TetR/AcrR family transcriptional regulator, regulator of autoinduction and epiphytic fitness
MSEPPIPKRAYNSTRRQAQAQQTRRQITAAAERLFIERGFARATIEAIAQEAEVAVETVYAAFGSKRQILAQVITVAVRGDDAPATLLERAGPRAVLTEPDARRALTYFAGDITAILSRVAPVYAVVRDTAKAEPEMASMWHGILRDRYANLEAVAQHLAELHSLRVGLGVTQATETIWALSSPDIFCLLATHRGYTNERFAGWLAESLILLLLE